MGMFLTRTASTGILTQGFEAITSAITFVTSNSILVLPIAIGLGCFAIKKAKRIFR